MSDCAFPGCSGAKLARGFCGAHWKQQRFGRPLTPIGQAAPKPMRDVFWQFVDKADGCWEWTGRRCETGYGMRGRRPKATLAHRFSWELHFGAIPPGMFVCHHCDNPPCVRPDHLFLGTADANNKDRARKGRTVVTHGERSPNALLTDHDVIDIKTLLAFGATRPRLADAYGVNYYTIERIHTGKTWRRVP